MYLALDRLDGKEIGSNEGAARSHGRDRGLHPEEGHAFRYGSESRLPEGVPWENRLPRGVPRMICSTCEIWKENERLRTENSKLKKENAELKQRLQIYENPNVPPSQRRYPTRSRSTCEKRFPGRPKGYPGKTRPVPRPDVVKRPEWGE